MSYKPGDDHTQCTALPVHRPHGVALRLPTNLTKRSMPSRRVGCRGGKIAAVAGSSATNSQTAKALEKLERTIRIRFRVFHRSYVHQICVGEHTQTVTSIHVLASVDERKLLSGLYETGACGKWEISIPGAFSTT